MACLIEGMYCKNERRESVRGIYNITGEMVVAPSQMKR